MILASGCFDGLHAGHIHYLQAAADVDPMHKLMVAIAPDIYVQDTKLHKTLWTEEERKFVVASLRQVDGVVTHGEHSVSDVIEALQPAYFVKGEDWRGKLPQDVIDACAAAGTKIIYTATDGQHNSDVRN